MIKRETNKKGLIYIGDKDGEEYYLDLNAPNVRGWSFMGLRPETEANLIQQARDEEPAEMLGLSSKDFETVERYFDYNKFADDMEDGWKDRHDIQAEREQDGETLYLGFGSGQDIFCYFKHYNITDYVSYLQHFDEVGLEERDFNYLNQIVQERKDKDTLKMTDVEKLKEKYLFTSYFKN